jgi:arsenite-transporting ATPase
VVHNRYRLGGEIEGRLFPEQTVIRLPVLPRSVSALERIQGAADLLF